MKELHRIDENLTGDTSKPEINIEELNMAAALTTLAMKVMDIMANVYQINNNLVRLGQNIDIVIGGLRDFTRDTDGTLQELKLRLDDLEAIKVTELGGRTQ